ncbi:MAG: nuclear transport factor 2 family protein [Armatimonadota bacterium]|nr:MAG: nuclear transport factor 2 family protein [Armatimonadota bacterium]
MERQVRWREVLGVAAGLVTITWAAIAVGGYVRVHSSHAPKAGHVRGWQPRTFEAGAHESERARREPPWGILGKDSAISREEHPAQPPVSAFSGRETASPPLRKEEIRAAVERWRRAQNHSDLEAYANCYAESCEVVDRNIRGQEGTYDHDSWLAHMRETLARVHQPHVGVNDLKITVGPEIDRATAQFHQSRFFDDYHDHGPKVIRLKKEGTKVLITHEELRWSSPI